MLGAPELSSPELAIEVRESNARSSSGKFSRVPSSNGLLWPDMMSVKAGHTGHWAAAKHAAAHCSQPQCKQKCSRYYKLFIYCATSINFYIGSCSFVSLLQGKATVGPPTLAKYLVRTSRNIYVCAYRITLPEFSIHSHLSRITATFVDTQRPRLRPWHHLLYLPQNRRRNYSIFMTRIATI